MTRSGIRLRLRTRYSIALVAAAVLITATVAGTMLAVWERTAGVMQRSSAEAMTTALLRQVEERARNLAMMLAESLAEPVANDDFQRIDNILGAVRDMSGVSYVLLYDADGRVLHDGTETNRTYGQPAPPGRLAVELRGGTPRMQRADERLRALAQIRIGDTLLGTVVLGLSTKAVRRDTGAMRADLAAIEDRSTWNLLQWALGLTAALCAVSVAAAFMFSARLSGPVVALTETARRIGRGEYDVEIPWKRRDELGELGSSIKTMAEDLRRTTVSRAYFNNIIESMLDGLMVISPAGTVEMVNRAACRLSGYEETELIGTDIRPLLECSDGRPPPFDGTDAVSAGHCIRDVHLLLTKTGGRLPVLFSTSTMTDTGSGTHIVCVFRDVSEMRRKERQLEAAKEQAEVGNRTKSEFLANISHELRSPLNAIIGFSEILKQELFGPLGSRRYKDYVDDIHASGAHLLELINDILDLSKIEAGKLVLHEEMTDVRAAVAACARLMHPRADAAGIKLVANVAPDLPQACLDPRKFKQVLLNLLSNGVKFTPPGGSVNVVAEIVETGQLRVSVSDDGIGIAPDDLETAMSTFGQVESSLSRRYDGTGLGLPLSKALVELHGGEIEIRSRTDEGTTVVVTFPAGRVAPRRPA